MVIGILTKNDNVNKEFGYIGRIPVRNLWLLMFYASDLLRLKDSKKIVFEENPDDVPDLVAEVLAREVERRLVRNLSFGYQKKQAYLGRVRGHIDLLSTERHQLLNRGLVACRFEDLSINTSRNRFIRAALNYISNIVSRSDLSHRCRILSNSLKQLGVLGDKPSRNEVSLERFSSHDSGDQFMVAAAKLAFDLALPTEFEGNKLFALPEREITWIRHLYEKAVGGFYDVVLDRQTWKVQPGKSIKWTIDWKTPGIDQILPEMETDIVLENYVTQKRIVIDTKFNSILTQGWYREESLRSAYLYQIYTYLRSQEGKGDPLAEHAAGLLLHPSIGQTVDEIVLIQGHAIRFATVDLTATITEIRSQLLKLIEFPPEFI